MGKGENAGYQHKGNMYLMLNSLPNNKFLDRSKLKASADQKNKRDSKNVFCFGKGRKHCGKRRKC